MPRTAAEIDVRRRARNMALQNLQMSAGVAAEPTPDAHPLGIVAQAKRMCELAEGVLRSAVLEADAVGVSWDLIGRTLGISKQAAHKRFASPPSPSREDIDRLVQMLTGPMSPGSAPISGLVSTWQSWADEVARGISARGFEVIDLRGPASPAIDSAALMTNSETRQLVMIGAVGGPGSTMIDVPSEPSRMPEWALPLLGGPRDE
jgi:hypothetical protein